MNDLPKSHLDILKNLRKIIDEKLNPFDWVYFKGYPTDEYRCYFCSKVGIDHFDESKVDSNHEKNCVFIQSLLELDAWINVETELIKL